MALLNKKTRATREPDEVVNLGRMGVAIWNQPKSGDHDLKFGRYYEGKDGGKALVGTTTPLSLTDDLLESQGRTYSRLAESGKIPEQLKPALAQLGKRLVEIVAEVRAGLPEATAQATPEPTPSVFGALGNGSSQENGASIS